MLGCIDFFLLQSPLYLMKLCLDNQQSPIEREKSLDASTVLRFMASGAVCSSVAHLILTPIDVVKTKVQTKPDTYNGGIVDTFKKVLNEEGARTFFDGWEPTFLGFFISGGVAFFLTEFFRRYYSSLIVSSMMAQSLLTEPGATSLVSSLEIPLIAASAATSGLLCCFLLAPFDAIRIRTVAQPGFADNIFGVVSRMVKEEGFLSLFSSVTAWILKEVPYNVVKFLVFDTFTEWAYSTFPAASEDIRLSLAVSLVGGTFGGIAASIVSNPADCIVSEMKKTKSDMSPWEAADVLRQRGGLKAFSSGLTLRMIFYSLLVSLQFLLYDAVRIALGVGSDDMKLYLNVLGAALKEVTDA
jgi:solute carrier family 25 phosphate transporter 3